jgi:uncharacterized protein (TIGR02246 family)
MKEAIMDVKKAIEDKNAAFNKAYQQGDAAGCAAVFTEDAIMLPTNEPMVRGKQAIQKFFQGFLDKVGGKNDNHIVEFGVEGDLTYQASTFTIPDARTPYQGKFVEILRRQEDGSWKVAVSIFNSDKPV